jgi:hypothetical protein
MSKSKRQTAVKLIFEKFNLLSDRDFKSWMLMNNDFLETMEKEQIIQARLSLDQTDNIWDKEIFSNMAEQYYNETYKQENE